MIALLHQDRRGVEHTILGKAAQGRQSLCAAYASSRSSYSQGCTDDFSDARGGDHWWRICWPERRQESLQICGEYHRRRPQKPPHFPATVVPGSDGWAITRRNCGANPRRIEEVQKGTRVDGRSDRF